MTSYPVFHCFNFTAQFLLTGLYPTTVKLFLSVHSAIKRETKEVKGIWFSFSSCFSVLPGKPPEFQNLRLFLRQFQSIFPKAFFQSLPEYLCFILILKTTDKIITIANQITFAFTLSLYDYIKPVIQYIMQIYICASALWKAGYDTRAALIGPGVHASHGMERSTHINGLRNTLKLMAAYLDLI